VDLTGEWHFTDEFTLGGVLSYVAASTATTMITSIASRPCVAL